jgi:16S rRNA (guanine966-N2)-methyltransferase
MDKLRRTTSRVKKALFDILGPRIKGARFLELYAGEGGVGIEALKRGARHVVFVEISKRNVSMIKKRLSQEMVNRGEVTVRGGEVIVEVHAKDVGEFLRTFVPSQVGDESSSEGLFDIVFADPPYSSEEYEVLIKGLSQFRGLKNDALICIEHFHKEPLPDSIDSFVLLKRYKYGDTILSFYRRNE